MIEGTIIMQDVGAAFGKLEQPAENGNEVFHFTFTDQSGLSCTVLWERATLIDFLDKTRQALGSVVLPAKPKLLLAGGGDAGP